MSGDVTVNGLPARPAARLKDGDLIVLYIPSPEPAVLVPEHIPFKVIYEDGDVAVIDKPAGLTVYPAPGHSSHTLANALLERYPDLAVFGPSLRPGIVHRLDKDTSGLMVIARNERSRQNLIEQFKSRSLKKCYLALVRGTLTPERGAIAAPIGRHPSNRKRMAILSRGREARTDYQVVRHFRGYTLVDACIQTGRTHQIRVHFAAIGHPVVGDQDYGTKSTLVGRQFLHAYLLEFNLPDDNQRRTFKSELPPDLETVLAALGGS